MISFSGLFFGGGMGTGNRQSHNRFWNSLMSGFRTFLPVSEQGDTFTRSGS